MTFDQIVVVAGFASVGIAAWRGLLTLAARAWGWVLPYAPERARRLALAAAASGLLAAALAY